MASAGMETGSGRNAGASSECSVCAVEDVSNQMTANSCCKVHHLNCDRPLTPSSAQDTTPRTDLCNCCCCLHGEEGVNYIVETLIDKAPGSIVPLKRESLPCTTVKDK